MFLGFSKNKSMVKSSIILFGFLGIILLSGEKVDSASEGASRLDQISSECLSCHEDVHDSSHSGSHAISIDYAEHAAGNKKLRPVSSLQKELVLFEGLITCKTCHGSDPHDGQKLTIDNSESGLCKACHLM